MTEKEKTSTSKNINQLINQLKINHNFSQISSEEYGNSKLILSSKMSNIDITTYTTMYRITSFENYATNYQGQEKEQE